MKRILGVFALGLHLAAAEPVPVILDTDMGNDVDDVMALAMLHSLESRGHCKLLAVTVSKDHALAAPFVDAVNTFYHRPDIPVGAVRDGATKEEGKFNGLVNATNDGKPRYPHDLEAGGAPEAVELLRKTLAGQADGSVVMIQVGFFTNLANLLDSGPDEFSPLSGEKLIRKKVKLLSLMAGAFQPIDGNPRYREYNVVQDIPAAQALARRWPTPRVWSGFEIGIAATYPHESIERDYNYLPHHPLKEAYYLFEPPPHDRPAWDPTSVLHAVLPDRGFFQLSENGRVTVDDEGVGLFETAGGGRDRHLVLEASSRSRVREAITLLSSEPPR